MLVRRQTWRAHNLSSRGLNLKIPIQFESHLFINWIIDLVIVHHTHTIYVVHAYQTIRVTIYLMGWGLFIFSYYLFLSVC